MLEQECEREKQINVLWFWECEVEEGKIEKFV
jgi:hypothetical protein